MEEAFKRIWKKTWNSQQNAISSRGAAASRCNTLGVGDRPMRKEVIELIT